MPTFIPTLPSLGRPGLPGFWVSNRRNLVISQRFTDAGNSISSPAVRRDLDSVMRRAGNRVIADYTSQVPRRSGNLARRSNWSVSIRDAIRTNRRRFGPGTAPARTLRVWQSRRGREASNAGNARHAHYVEYGTSTSSRFGARPFLREAGFRHLNDDLSDEIADLLSNAVITQI